MRKLLGTTKMFVKRNGSTILTCLGGVGTVATAVLAVKATPKALKAIEEAKEEKSEELTVFETVTTVGPVYIPAIAVGVSTLACMFGANVLNKRQQVGLASAYALLENSFKMYKHKVEELYGEEVSREIVEDIARDKYEEESFKIDASKLIFYDELSKRHFESTMEQVQLAEYMLNRTVSVSGYATVNDFYELLGIEPIDGGDKIGWSAGQVYDAYWVSWIDFCHTEFELSDGTKCYSITTPMEPTIDFIDY